MPADPLASGLAEAFSTETGFRCGFLRNDSQLNTPKAILIDLIPALPVCLIILAVGLILLTMQLNISELLWSFSKKLAIFWLVFGLCWKVLEKNGVAVRQLGMPEQQTSRWRRRFTWVSVAAYPFLVCGGRVFPLHLMDDVLGQAMIFLDLPC
ncbi:hypothetical protein ACNKHX_02515 [Shigella flexneri]